MQPPISFEIDLAVIIHKESLLSSTYCIQKSPYLIQDGNVTRLDNNPRVKPTTLIPCIETWYTGTYNSHKLNYGIRYTKNFHGELWLGQSEPWNWCTCIQTIIYINTAKKICIWYQIRVLFLFSYDTNNEKRHHYTCTRYDITINEVGLNACLTLNIIVLICTIKQLLRRIIHYCCRYKSSSYRL